MFGASCKGIRVDNIKVDELDLKSNVCMYDMAVCIRCGKERDMRCGGMWKGPKSATYIRVQL